MDFSKLIDVRGLTNPYLLYLPFLLIYVALVLLLHTDEMVHDEGRYFTYAENLLNGFYSPEGKLNLWSGPGYPIFLMPFVFFKTPLIFITLMNAFLHYFSIIILYKTIKYLLNRRLAVLVGLIWGAHYISYKEIPHILTEPLTTALIISIVYFILRAFSEDDSKNKFYAGLLLGYLALTKVIFGYVILILLFSYGVISIIQLIRRKRAFKTELTILVLAMVVLIPYITYTYRLTSKVFYLADSGGMSLYFMSNPHKWEYGDWNGKNLDANCREGLPCYTEYMVANHREDFEYIYAVEGVERDDRFKELAFRNIKSHPAKFLRNCFANQGRLWFGFPKSFFYERDVTLIRVFPNAILFTAFCFFLIYWFVNIRTFRKDLLFIFLLFVLYFGGSTLLSAYARMLNIMIPLLLVLISYALNKSVKVKLLNED